MIVGFPEFLLNVERLNELISMLLEKEAVRKSLKGRDFGHPVFDQKEAMELLQKVARYADLLISRQGNPVPPPRLFLTDELSRLPGQTLRTYLFFFPLSAILFLLGMSGPGHSTGLYIPIAASVSLLIMPLLLHRRTRIHLEHRCGYGRDREGRPIILIDHLPSVRFQSYVAHEYAHHLYTRLWGESAEEWIREGWSRLVQWEVAQRLSRVEKNPAYLYHVLAQITGELKFACEIIAEGVNTRLPRRVRRIWTIYHTNPVYTLLTGTPLSTVPSLIHHAVGTAGYLLAAEHFGLKAALEQSPEILFKYVAPLSDRADAPR